MKIKPVILAGGKGTRLWPFSKEVYPKQFLKIFSGKSLFQHTLERHQGSNFDQSLVIIGEEHRFIAAEQIREISVKAEIIVEPEQKNTAPCVMVAALHNVDYKGALLIAPTDHLITNIRYYRSNINSLTHVVSQGKIATLGIEPSYPHTGYGYITIGEDIDKNIFAVKAFREKPSLQIAQHYLSQSFHLWHSGIFLSTPQTLLREAEIYEKSMLESVRNSLQYRQEDKDFIWLSDKHYKKITPNSIDYSILEKSTNLAVIKAKFDWQDIGNWNSLWQVSDKDENNNAVYGNILLEGVNSSYINTNNKLTVVLGVNDLIIVNTDEVTLVAHKSKSEEIKTMVQRLKKPIYSKFI
jgi:mannose-1-phosphate guanylyltransferase/mannose-6-phosphate isomerase